MEYPKEGTRTAAFWQYIKQFFCESNGEMPQIRDFIKDDIDNVTSTSAVAFQLHKLVKMGLLEHIEEENKRSKYRIVGTLSILPANILRDREEDQYYEPMHVDNVQILLAFIDAAHRNTLHRTMVATQNKQVAIIAAAMGMGVLQDG